MSRYTIDLYHLQRDAVFNSLEDFKSEKVKERYMNITLGFHSGKQSHSTFHMLKDDNNAFKKVASFHQEDNSINNVFSLTQNAHESWIENLPSSVEYNGDLDGCKSSAIGDFVVIKDNDNPDVEPKIYAFSFDGYNEFGNLIRRKVLEIIDNPKDKVVSKPKV